ncbi:MAG: NAD-dependent epimerase [Halioglobus sp.]
MQLLVTGAAGFIGYHVCARLLADGHHVVGLDSLNDYYEVSLKEARLAKLRNTANFEFVLANLQDEDTINATFDSYSFDIVINLAAQAGVRYSLENPRAYIDSNVVGFTNVLECCRAHAIGHLVYASSSSVYGMNASMPFSIHDNVDHPLSLYAASKKTNELMAHTYSHLYQLPTTGLRFFTVYGPWGRPDMALFLFTRAILNNQPIQVFNNGDMRRDFTYIDDIVEGVVRIAMQPAKPNANWNAMQPDPASSLAPYRLYNIGNNNPVNLNEFIAAIEDAVGKKAKRELLPMQPGDVASTYADVDDLVTAVDYQPSTPISVGVKRFVDWYLEYTSDNRGTGSRL